MYTVCHVLESKDRDGWISTEHGYVVVDSETYVRIDDMVYRLYSWAVVAAEQLNEKEI